MLSGYLGDSSAVLLPWFYLLPQLEVESRDRVVVDKRCEFDCYNLAMGALVEKVYLSYKRDLKFINHAFFDNLMFEADDIVFEAEGSLRGSVITIVQLMLQNKATKLLVNCLSDF